jgi:HSP20 family protein
MSTIEVEKVEDGTLNRLPVFEQIEKHLKDVRCRAFDLFEGRGCEPGHDLEDWLKAEREEFGQCAEMVETEKEYELQMALAGFDAKEVQVTASPSEIMVHAQTKAEKKTEKSNVVWTEFGSHDVYRRFEMPQPVKWENTTATLDKGILRIKVAKATAAKEKLSVGVSSAA